MRLSLFVCRLAVLVGCASALPTEAADHFEPIYAVDFRQTPALDPQFWGRITGISPSHQVTYTEGDQNLLFADGLLRLEARKQWLPNPLHNHPKAPADQAAIAGRAISSANVVSKTYFQYGRFEVVARVPDSVGSHPAIWLQGKNQGQYGEIHIMEAIGRKALGVGFVTVHYGQAVGALAKQTASWPVSAGFHRYTLEWIPDRIQVFYDGVSVLSVSPDLGKVDGRDALRQPMQLRLNLAMGSRRSGEPDLAALPVQFDVQSVKIWRYGLL